MHSHCNAAGKMKRLFSVWEPLPSIDHIYFFSVHFFQEVYEPSLTFIPSQCSDVGVCIVSVVYTSFQLPSWYLEIAVRKLSASSATLTEPCKDQFRCCNKFSSPLWNVDSFGCKVAQSPIAGQSHWLDSPLNIILDVLKGTLAACASCSGKYWSSTSSQRGWRAKKFSLSLLSDREPHGNLMYNGCYVCFTPTHVAQTVIGVAFKSIGIKKQCCEVCFGTNELSSWNAFCFALLRFFPPLSIICIRFCL